MRVLNILVLSAFLAFGAGCGDDDDDGGTTGRDAGTINRDAGSGNQDAGNGNGDAGVDDDAGQPGDAGGDAGVIGDGAVSDAGNLGDFEASFTGYNPHSGQLFELKVIRESDSMEVGRTSVAAVPPNGMIDVTIAGIIEDGVDYQIDWYADLSDNGSYDAPPTDHAWRATGETGGPAGLTFAHSHDTNFTDIMF